MKHGGNRTGARARLMTSASAATLALMLAGTPAMAQGAGDDARSYWVLELSGGIPFGDKAIWSTGAGEMGGPLDIRPDFTVGGTVGVMMPMARLFEGAGPEWSAGVFARLTRSNRADERSTYSYGYYPGDAIAAMISGYVQKGRHQETHGFVDFEARRDVGLGLGENVSFEAIMGLRFGVFNAETDLTASYFSLLGHAHGRSFFVGLGPRLGGALTVEFGDGFSFGADASAAILLGHRRSQTTSSSIAAMASVLSFRRSGFDAVPMLEGSLALNYDLGSSGTMLSGGLNFSAIFGAHDKRGVFAGLPGGPFGLGGRNLDRYSIGPFVRLTMPFGGN